MSADAMARPRQLDRIALHGNDGELLGSLYRGIGWLWACQMVGGTCRCGDRADTLAKALVALGAHLHVEHGVNVEGG